MTRTLPSRHRKTLAALAVAVLGATVLGGCDSGDASSGSGDTIKIGYTNRESTAGGLPEWRYGGLAAIDYLNAHGGIDGVKIEPVTCLTDGSPESSINCANQFLDQGVTLQFMGLDIGSDAALPILSEAGIPVVGPVAGGTVQLTDPNTFLFGGLGPDAAGTLQALKNQGAHRVTAVIYAGVPSIQATYDVIKTTGEHLGLQVDKLEVPLTNADWTASVASALTNPPDAFLLATRENDCTDMLRALHAAHYPGVSGFIACTAYLKALGAQAPATVAAVRAWTPDLRSSAPADVQPRIDIYSQAMTAIGQPGLVDTAGASRSFSAMMELGDILRGIPGPVTAQTAKTALQQAHNVPGYLGPDLHCGMSVWPSESSVCSAEELLLRIVPDGDGLRREVMGTGFVDLSASGR